MRKISFLFGVHLHQPVGNFPDVFRYATDHAYLPFLRAMKNATDFPFAFHASGPLWEYWESEAPEIYDLVAEMAERGQLELLGGGFYEPILSVIPRRDALSQLRWMADFLEENFGQRPRGIWLTERIWEPHLPEILQSAGVEFTLVDDYHFKSAGIIGERLLGHFLTEDRGHSLKIFPISQELRYTIPFAKPSETLEILVRNADRTGNRCLVFGDDGEKFGLWPGTEKWVWNEGWMSRFIETILDNQKVVKPGHFGEWIDSHPPTGKAYLPTGSYFEMSEWTLPPELAEDFHRKVEDIREKGTIEEWRPFLKGGFWRGFLTKYPESSWMYHRMLEASQKLVNSGLPKGEAAKSLYRAQCNCAYWHGVFGGLYLPHLRRGIYDNILRAEKLLFPAKKSENSALRIDIDLDGRDEVIMRSSQLALYVTPADGGKIAEIDLVPWERNITDILSRRPEGYHQRVSASGDSDDGETASIHDIAQSKEEGLEKLLHYDWYNRRFLVDFIFGEGLTPENFRSGDFPELGDFANRPYKIIHSPSGQGELSLLMRREGGIYHGDRRTPLIITKEIILREDGYSFAAKYTIENPSDRELKLHFGAETHFSLMSRDHPEVHFHFPESEIKNIRSGEMREFSRVSTYELHEAADGFKITCRQDECELWMWPVETVSNSESGFERVYQATSLLHLWKFVLPSGGTKEIELSWNVEPLDSDDI